MLVGAHALLDFLTRETYICFGRIQSAFERYRDETGAVTGRINLRGMHKLDYVALSGQQMSARYFYFFTVLSC